MGLHLSDSRLGELEHTLAVLAAPFDFPSGGDWMEAVNQRVATLFGAAGVGSVVSGASDEPISRFHGIDESVVRTYRGIVNVTEDGDVRLDYPGPDRVMRRLAAAGVRIWTPEMAGRLTGIPWKEMPYTRDVIEPAGMLHHVTMSVPLPEGMAVMAFYHASPDHDPLGEDRVRLLQLLLPAFRSGIRALRGVRLGRDALVDYLEREPMPRLILGQDGRELYRNGAAGSLLSGEAGAPLREACQRLVDRLGELRSPARKSDSGRPFLDREPVVSVGASRFRISATFLPEGLADPGWTALVRIEPLSASLPAPAAIERRLGLTPRQSEVARLIAMGLTSREIARRLDISVHTARRHTEAILSRLELSSRAGVALRLLGRGPAGRPG